MTLEEFRAKLEEFKTQTNTTAKTEEKPKTDTEKFKQSPLYLKLRERLENLKGGKK